MKDETLLGLLEETLKSLEVRLAYDDLRKGDVNTDGGMFLLKGEKRVLVHKGLPVKEKIEVLVKVLSSLDTEGVPLPPAIRRKIERVREHS